ncbi:MAG: sigma 54-interacting transcriptional regulator [Bacillota bacterium]|nr:sigma 54-interacting transcriptional regulator [Bacillota bacterium]
MNIFDEFFNKNTLYFDAFDRITEAIYVCDIGGNLVYFNKAAEKLDGYLLKDVKGRSTFDLYGLDETNSPMLKALVTEKPIHNEEFSYYVNGKEIVQLCNAGPIYDEGKLVGAYTIQRDLTMFRDMVERNIALQRELSKQKKLVSEDIPKPAAFANLIGSSPLFKRCKDLAWRAAKTDSSIMLIGSTGSGKEVFARAIHDQSNRNKGPFLALNCAAIPESLIEGILFGTTKGVYTGAVEKEGLLAQAGGGTIFLDEVNSMPLPSQAKLLRVLEERKIMKLGSDKEQDIDVRIISSSNEIPQAAINNGHMREDLFYRLSVVQIPIPALSERPEDIPELVQHFVNKYNKKFKKNVLGVNGLVMDYFLSFSWPGNVRQLRACVESAMNFAKDDSYITLNDLPQYVLEDTKKPRSPYHNKITKENQSGLERTASLSPSAEHPGAEIKVMDTIWNEEREKIILALRQAKGNMTQAAKSMGISRQLLFYRLKKYNIK